MLLFFGPLEPQGASLSSGSRAISLSTVNPSSWAPAGLRLLPIFTAQERMCLWEKPEEGGLHGSPGHVPA